MKKLLLICTVMLALSLLFTACGGESAGGHTPGDAETTNISSDNQNQTNSPTLTVSSTKVRLSSDNAFVQVLDVTSNPTDVYYLIADTSIVNCAWSLEWNNSTTQLTIYGLKDGVTNVYIYCSKDGNFGNAVASITLTVTVDMGESSDNNNSNNNNNEQTGSKGLTFYEYGNGYKVYGGSCADENVVIPSTHKGLPVVAIDDYAFAQNTNIKSIVIPDSVTKIGECAFWRCEKLVSVNIPKNVTDIGDSAFGDCSKLSAVNIPNNITEIGADMFMACESLTEIVIPEGVTVIGENAFKGCTALTAVNLPNSLTKIERYAFAECEGFTVVKIGDHVKTIGENAFSNCRNLTTVILSDSVQTIKEMAFSKCVRLTNLYLGSGVTDICYMAFYGCDNLSRAFYNGTEAKWKKVINEGISCDIFTGEQPQGEIVDIEDKMTKILVLTGEYNGTMYLAPQFKDIANYDSIIEYHFVIEVYNTNGKLAYLYTYTVTSDGTDSLNKLFALPHCESAQGYEVVISQIGIRYNNGTSEIAFTDYSKTISVGTELTNVSEDKIVNPNNT